MFIFLWNDMGVGNIIIGIMLLVMIGLLFSVGLWIIFVVVVFKVLGNLGVCVIIGLGWNKVVDLNVFDVGFDI